MNIIVYEFFETQVKRFNITQKFDRFLRKKQN